MAIKPCALPCRERVPAFAYATHCTVPHFLAPCRTWLDAAHFLDCLTWLSALLTLSITTWLNAARFPFRPGSVPPDSVPPFPFRPGSVPPTSISTWLSAAIPFLPGSLPPNLHYYLAPCRPFSFVTWFIAAHVPSTWLNAALLPTPPGSAALVCLVVCVGVAFVSVFIPFCCCPLHFLCSLMLSWSHFLMPAVDFELNGVASKKKNLLRAKGHHLDIEICCELRFSLCE